MPFSKIVNSTTLLLAHLNLQSTATVDPMIILITAAIIKRRIMLLLNLKMQRNLKFNPDAKSATKSIARVKFHQVMPLSSPSLLYRRGFKRRKKYSSKKSRYQRISVPRDHFWLLLLALTRTL